MALSRYHKELQDRVGSTDTSWCYTVPDLPQPTLTDAGGYMKSCSLVSNPNQQNITLSFIKILANRAISERPLNSFIHITCEDFRLQESGGTAAPFKLSADYVSRFLSSGIKLNGTHYNFYGHSQSQLKSKACFLMAGSKEEVNKVVDGLGDFSKINSVAKKVKRIGLLFSTALIVMNIDPSRCRDVADVENEDYIFTDGCGLISLNLASMLTRKRPINFRNRRYHPSVFQIRYRGYKGVVTVHPKMSTGVWLEFRKSMKKFSGGHHLGFAVVEYSKPYTYGYLNDEVVLLLHSLGIETKILLRKQQEHLDILHEAERDPRVAFRLLSSLGHYETAEKLLLDGLETVARNVSKMVNEERTKMLNKRGEQKCRILIPRSRLLFGVCDPRDLLRPGECFVKVTHEDGITRAVTNAWVLVARNPCLHPGDLQKFWAVANPELEHLVDCIVFSTQGRRAAADLMSGGDLDGDTFFVCWDPELVPATISDPAEYPAGKEKIQFKPITHQDRIDYFAHSSSMQLGRIKKLYLQWARHTGPMSPQCQELNRLFSQCVDATRVKIPDRLENLPLTPKNAPFVLDVLHDAAISFIKSHATKISFNELCSLETLEDILSDDPSMSQFELAQLTLRWCQINATRFEDLWLHFDPRKFSVEERIWLLAQLSPSQQTPSLVMNDLLHSNILAPSELQHFGLQHPRIRWRLVFSSTQERLGNLMNVVNQTFSTFTRKFLVLHIHERLSVAMYIPIKISKLDDCLVGVRIRLFSFPHGQKSDQTHRPVVPTKHGSRLYYDESALQLYEGKRGNTFVFLTRSANDDSRYRGKKGQGERSRLRQETIAEGINCEWRTSIALNKFSQGLAKNIGRVYREGISAAELYVISNNDTRSFQQLDLWLEQIDTDTIIHNFEASDDEFSVPCLTEIDWTNKSKRVVEIARDRKFEGLSSMHDVEDMAGILEISWQTTAFDLASETYQRYLAPLGGDNEEEANSKMVVLRHMVDFLEFMPLLVVHFIRIGLWINLAPCMRAVLRSSALKFLRALILSASQMGRLAMEHIRVVLQQLNSLTVIEYRDLVEMASLTISSPELGMDILLGAFEPCSTRILLETPQKTEYLVRSLTGTALEHIEESADQAKSGGRDPQYAWKLEKPLLETEKGLMLNTAQRIDASRTSKLAKGDHVRFTSVGEPSNTVLPNPITFEAIVEASQDGEVTFRCLRRPPAFYQRCWWNLKNCCSFVTSKTMMDAVADLMARKKECCRIFDNLFPGSSENHGSQTDHNFRMTPLPRMDLNSSQHTAITTTLKAPMTLIWGPPGTGKTHTISALIKELVNLKETGRLLVTAPTHNAVDNVLRKFVGRLQKGQAPPLRVSTDIHKVSKDLLHLTCDAMLGHDLNSNHAARRKAQKQISASRLIFTTCVGAGLGLLRTESFDTVIIDEASQLTEPASLISLVKGCKKSILVGDHVQLRATVRPNAATLGFDVSLFERLWTESSSSHKSAVQKVMLDTQYRMHPSLCSFPSAEFYKSKLLAAPSCTDIPVPAADSIFDGISANQRAVFVQCSDAEDLGLRSKSNHGQAKLCQEIVRRLKTAQENPQRSTASLCTAPSYSSASIAVLTPYTRQLTLLRSLVPDPEVKISTIDGFQGQEADIIVYVTVRCNVHGEVGFLKDLRRLNVAITRPRAGLIIIGDKGTLLASKAAEGEAGEAARVWHRLLQVCAEIKV